MALLQGVKLALLLLALGVLPGQSVESKSSQHADRQTQRKRTREAAVTADVRPEGLGPDDPWIEHLSWRPRAWLYHNFLTDEEAEHVIELAKPSMARSTVVDSESGDSVLDPIRTSQGTFLTMYQTPIIRDIEDRIAHWTHIPAEFGEDLQVLKYEYGQKYEAHWDWFDADEIKKMGGDDSNRIATILIYLSDVEEGGETSFSKSKWLNETTQRHSQPSECAMAKVFVKPRKGDALLFWDLKPDGQTGDKWSMHAGCPVIRGEKWSATKWLHNGPQRDASQMQRMAAERASIKCEDKHDSCPKWAKQGDCLSNAPYMVGTAATPGNCLKSCEACISCAQGDLVCQRKSARMQKAKINAAKQAADAKQAANE